MKKVFALLLLVVFVCTGCSTTRVHKREIQYIKARDLLEEERYKDAVAYLNDKLEEVEDWRYYYYRAFAYLISFGILFSSYCL